MKILRINRILVTLLLCACTAFIFIFARKFIYNGIERKKQYGIRGASRAGADPFAEGD